MESCIKQNNAIEIYQDYFNEIDEATDCEEPKAKVCGMLSKEGSNQKKDGTLFFPGPDSEPVPGPRVC